MLVRPARASDAEALVPVFEDWSHPQPADVIAERLRAWADEPRAKVLVAELDGAVVGLAAVSASLHVARPGRFGRLAGLRSGMTPAAAASAPRSSAPPRSSPAAGAATGSRRRPRAGAKKRPRSTRRSATRTSP